MYDRTQFCELGAVPRVVEVESSPNDFRLCSHTQLPYTRSLVEGN